MPHPRPGRVVTEKQYADLVLSMAPVSYWRLGERSGTVARDVMSRNHGTYVAAPTLGVAGALAGDGDTAVTFNGTSQYVDAGASASLQPGDTISIAAWVKRATTGATAAVASSGWGKWWFGFRSDDSLWFQEVAGGAIFLSAVGAADLTSWHHYAVTKNGATTTVYRDGVAVAGTVTNRTLTTGGSPVYIAASYNWNGSAFAAADFFDGPLDEVAIWNRALTAAEVAALYAAGAGR